MSLVKKLEPGGSIDNDSLNNELSMELASYNLPAKKEKLVKDKLVELRDYLGKQGNSLSIDSLANKYTISGPGAEKFQGSPDDIKSNWLTGGLRVQDDQDAMSIAAAIYGSAHKKIKGSSPISTKQKLNISDLSNYIIDKVYGTSDAFSSDFLEGIKSDDERKKKVLEYADQHVSNYLKEAEENKDLGDFVDIENAKAVQSAIASGDWDSFKKASYKMKWNPNDFLISESQKEYFAEGEAKKKEEEEKKNLEVQINDTKAKLLSSGFSEELAGKISSAGYKFGTLNFPSGLNPNINIFTDEYLKGENAVVLENSNGQSVWTPEGILNLSGEKFDEFNPLHGIAWKHDENGKLSFVQSSYKRPDWIKDGVQLQGTVDGFEGASIEGYSDPDSENKDYKDKLIVTKGNIRTELFKGKDGIYRSENGQPYKVNLTGYNQEEKIVPFNAQEDFAQFYDPNLKVSNDYNYLSDYIDLASGIKVGEWGGKYTDVAKRLVYSLINNKDLQLKPNTINSIIRLLDQYDQRINRTTSRNQPNITMKKSGGVLFLQKGDALQEYRNRKKSSTSSEPTVSSEPQKEGFGDITGTWKGMGASEKTMRAASIAGTLGSFVPGPVGAISASTVLASDIGADIVKDGFQWSDVFNWNTAANVGFIALSTIGLGGVKALLKAEKIAKSGSDIAKTVSKASKYKSALGITDQEVKALDKVVKVADKLGAKNSEQLLSKLDDLKKLTPKKGVKTFNKNVKELEDGLSVLGKVAGESTPIAGSIFLGKTLPKVGSKVISTVGGKTAQTALKVGLMAPGLMAIPQVAGTIYNHGFEYTKPEDIKDIAIAGSIGKNWIKDLKGIKALKRQRVEGESGANKTTFKLGDDEITLNKAIEKPKSSKKPLAWGKKANEKSLSQYKEEIKAAAKEEGVVIQKGELDKLTLKDFEISKTSNTGKFTFGKMVETGKGRVVDTRDFNLAKKYREQMNKKSVPDVEMKNVVVLTAKDKSRIKFLTNEIQLMEKTMASYKKPNAIVNRSLAKKKEELKKLNNSIDYKDLFKFQEGGILKFQNPWTSLPEINDPYKKYRTTTTTTPTTQTNPRVKPVAGPSTIFNKANISGNLDSNSLNDPRYKGDQYWGGKENYKKNWIPLVQRTVNDPEKLNILIQKIANYQGQDADDTKALLNNAKTLEEKRELIERLNSDGKIGPYHQMIREIGDSSPTMKSIGIPSTVNIPNIPTINPVSNPNPVSNSVKPSSDGSIPIIPKQKSKFDWETLGINPANLHMFMNTLGANRAIGRAQRMAISDGLFQLPYMPKTYLRIDRPNTLFAEKQAGNLRSKAGRLARGVGDIDKANAVMLQGESQVDEIQTKGQQADLQRFDQLRGSQLENNAKIDEYNTGVLGRNRGMSAEAFSKIHLINANQINAQNTAANNFITSVDRDMKIGKYKADMNKYWNTINDPKIKDVTKEYSSIAGQEGYDKAKALYEQNKLKVGSANYAQSFENSDEYKNWQNQVKEKKTILDQILEPARYQQSYLQFTQPTRFLKKGGKSRTKQEEIDIDNNRYNNLRKLKSAEMAFKSIMHNNEMLQKALIKVFK